MRNQANFEKLKRIPASDRYPYLDKKQDAQPGDPDVKTRESRYLDCTYGLKGALYLKHSPQPSNTSLYAGILPSCGGNSH